MKEKLNDLVRFHKEMQWKLKAASYSEQIQTLILVPDKWSQMVSICTIWDTGSNIEILKQEILQQQLLSTTRPCCSTEFIESFLFWVILVTYNIDLYICIYICKVSYIHSFFLFFLVIFNCNTFSALHAKHFEIRKNLLWNWWVNCFIARHIKWCDISECS